jgi:hypothetical protein
MKIALVKDDRDRDRDRGKSDSWRSPKTGVMRELLECC